MKKLTILLIACMLFLSACDTIPWRGDNDISIDYDKIHSGTQGLVITRIPGAPPSELYEDQAFSFVADIHNKGASEITEGIIKLIFDKDYIESDESVEGTFSLEGKTIYNPKGDSQMPSFILKAKPIPQNMSTQVESEIILTSCYKYSTELRTEVCMDNDYFNINNANKEKACFVRAQSPSSQGAPLQVTKIEPKFTTRDSKVIPQYLIHIKNMGTGTVINENKIQEVCGPNALSTEDLNTAFVTASLGDKKMLCMPGDAGIGKLRLKKGEDFVKCYLEEPIEEGSAPYLTWLLVNVTYAYTESLSSMVTIKRLI